MTQDERTLEQGRSTHATDRKMNEHSADMSDNDTERPSRGVSRTAPSSQSPHRQRRRRSVSLCSNASLDEFGRVKRRRKEVKPEDGDDRLSEYSTDSRARSRYDDWRGRRRSRSRSLSEDRGWRSRHRYDNERVRSPGRGDGGSPVRGDGFYKKSVHVTDLPFGVTHYDLREHFEKVGKVSGIKLFLHKPSRYGFITFAASESADRAITELDGTYVLGECIQVSRARVPEPVKKGTPWWQDLDGARSGGYTAHENRGLPQSRTTMTATTTSGSAFDDLLLEYSSIVEKVEKPKSPAVVSGSDARKGASKGLPTLLKAEKPGAESEDGEVSD
ncbi:hypothetical protein BC829DRAFT_406956 [Chytridium lagenaria]|nr:hypothetical protein BC829DRAFT_406956 [Chytridium lagenaria]